MESDPSQTPHRASIPPEEVALLVDAARCAGKVMAAAPMGAVLMMVKSDEPGMWFVLEPEANTADAWRAAALEAVQQFQEVDADAKHEDAWDTVVRNINNFTRTDRVLIVLVAPTGVTGAELGPEHLKALLDRASAPVVDVSTEALARQVADAVAAQLDEAGVGGCVVVQRDPEKSFENQVRVFTKERSAEGRALIEEMLRACALLAKDDKKRDQLLTSADLVRLRPPKGVYIMFDPRGYGPIMLLDVLPKGAQVLS